MKTRFKHLATVLLCGLLAASAHAAVPLSWETRPGSPAPVSFDRHHGETLELRCTLSGFGQDGPVFAQGADIRLWYQTNGMGSVWWSAPAAVASNVVTATWSPDLDPGADRVSIFLGAPSNVYASAVLRLRHSPGFTPASLPIPVPPLDFAGLEVLNAPYYTQAETDARIVELSPAAQPPGNYLAVSNAAMSAAAATNDFLRLTDGTMAGDIRFGDNIRLTDAFSQGFLLVNNDEEWKFGGANDSAVDVMRRGDLSAVARAATNYTDFVIGQFDPPIPMFDVYAEDVTNVSLAVTSSAISTNNQAFVTAVRNVPIAGADSSDLAEIAEYGSYGTVGAAILALIAGLAALERGKVSGVYTNGGWAIENGQRYYRFGANQDVDDSTVALVGDLRYAKHTLTTPAGAATLLDRAVNKYTGDSTFTSCTFTLPPAIEGKVRDFLLDIDNSDNGSDVAAEFYGLGTDYALAVNADEVTSSKTAGEVLAEMTVVEAGTRARLYFTEANQTQVATVGNESVDLPILTVQRMTIAPTTVQGGAA